MPKSKSPLRSPKANYRDELSTPIELPVPAGMRTASYWRQARREALQASLTKRLPKLFEHYNLQFGEWEELALALAVRHVPGLTWRDAVRKGRPNRVWTLGRLSELQRNIESTMAEKPGRTVATSARVVARREPWAALLTGDSNPSEVLRTKYFQIMSKEPKPDSFATEPVTPSNRAKRKKV